jgi:hydrophobic/amphiphilic exporter-1 (mainly G- bacteria), HAE1 family
MLSAYWADPQTEAHERRNPIARALDRFNNWFNSMAEKYRGVILWGLKHRAAVVGLAALTFVAALALPATGLVGASFFGEDDQSELTIAIDTPPGSNLDYTRLKSEEAARIARSHKEVRYTWTTIGGATGAVDEATIFVRLVKKNERDIGAEPLAKQIRGEVTKVGGMTASVFTNLFQGQQKQIQIQLTGASAEVLTTVGSEIMQKITPIEGAVDVALSSKGQKPELTIDINRGLAGTLGVTLGQIAQSLRPAFAGIDAGDWVDPTGETRDVTIRLAPEARQRAVDLERLPLVVRGSSGSPSTLPLGQIATINEELGPAVVNHFQGDLVVNVEANTSGRPLNEVMRDINVVLAEVKLPPGVVITQGGEVDSQNEVFGRIFTALGIAIMLMYLILVMQFGSFIEPLAILVSLPLSLIGVMLALWITNDTINIMSLIGVILLMGIVAKNAILLIDFAKWAREREGMPRRQALVEAGAIRLRPIMMTTAALIAGMLPVALGWGEGAQFRAPLGRAVIGGVITSTLLTLLVIPVAYDILDSWREALLTRLGLFKRRTGMHAVPEGARNVAATERA